MPRFKLFDSIKNERLASGLYTENFYDSFFNGDFYRMNWDQKKRYLQTPTCSKLIDDFFDSFEAMASVAVLAVVTALLIPSLMNAFILTAAIALAAALVTVAIYKDDGCRP